MNEEGTCVPGMATLDMATAAIDASNVAVLRDAVDAILASFPSVVEVMHTTVTIQTASAGQNQARPADEKLHIRIGIDLRDVIDDRGEICGGR